MPTPLPLAVSSSCVTGDDPSTGVERLLCRMPTSVEDFLPLLGFWPHLVAAVAVLAAGWCVWRIWCRHIWIANAGRGVWLEIVPPVTANPLTTADLWRLLARLLPAPKRWTGRPKRLVFEVHAQGERMRAGIWVPPRIPALHVTQKITQAWPGARVTQTSPPRLPDDAVLHGVRLALSGPDCVDYVPAIPAGYDIDRQRAVFDALAGGGRSGGALMQIVVQGPAGHRRSIMRRAVADPAKAATPGITRAAEFCARGLAGALSGLVGLFRSGPPRATQRPYLSEEMIDRRDRAKAKRAARPHFLAGVRIFTSGDNRGEAKANANNIASGFALFAPDLGVRRLHRPGLLAASRWAPESHLILSSIGEVAALAGLPAESAAFGLPQAASRRRPPTAESWAPQAPDRQGEDRPRFDPWGMA